LASFSVKGVNGVDPVPSDGGTGPLKAVPVALAPKPVVPVGVDPKPGLLPPKAAVPVVPVVPAPKPVLLLKRPPVDVLPKPEFVLLLVELNPPNPAPPDVVVPVPKRPLPAVVAGVDPNPVRFWLFPKSEVVWLLVEPNPVRSHVS